MRIRKSYYKSYRGRKSPREKKLIAFSAVLFLVLTAALGFFIIPEYIIFTSDGFRFTFQNQDAPTGEPQTGGDMDGSFPVIIDKTPDPDVLTAPPMPPAVGVIDNIDNLLKPGYAAGLAKAAVERGCNTLFFTVKNEDGVSRIPVTSAYSSQGSQSPKAEEIKAALSAAGSEEIYLAAVVSAFKDDILTKAFPECSIKTAGGGVWRDKSGKPRVDPYSAEAAEYLCDIVESCARAGFDAVIFKDLSFPSGMTLGENDGFEERAEAINAVLKAACEVAWREGMAVSVALDKPAAENPEAGQAAASMSAYCQSIFYWGELSQTQYAELSAAVPEGCFIGSVTASAFSQPPENRSLIAGYLK